MGTEQNRAGQNRTEQNRTEQNRTEGRGKARRLCSSRRGSWEDGGVLWREGRGRVYYGCIMGVCVVAIRVQQMMRQMTHRLSHPQACGTRRRMSCFRRC